MIRLKLQGEFIDMVKNSRYKYLGLQISINGIDTDYEIKKIKEKL